MQAIFEKVRRPTDASFRCYEVVLEEFPFLWHYHPEYELTLIVRGRGTRFVGDSIAEFSEGDLVLIGPDMPHTWCTDAPGRGSRATHRAVGVQFGRDFLGERFFHLPEMQRVRAMLEQCGRGLTFPRRVCAQAHPVLVALQGMEPDKRLLALLGVLAGLSKAKARPLASDGFRPSRATGAARRIDLVFKHINEHLTTGVGHAELARLAHMNPASFSRFFRNTVGKTLTDYVNELRVGLACRLLIESDVSVLEVCHRSGFNNFSNFSRRFKAIKKASPRRFRANFQITRRKPGQG